MQPRTSGQRAAHETGHCGDETGIVILRGHAEIAGNAQPGRQRAVFDIELDQGLRVFGDEGDGHDQHRHLILCRVLDRPLGAGFEPFLRGRARLIADHPVEAGKLQSRNDGSDGPLDLELVGIAGPHDGFRQAVRREEDAQGAGRFE